MIGRYTSVIFSELLIKNYVEAVIDRPNRVLNQIRFCLWHNFFSSEANYRDYNCATNSSWRSVTIGLLYEKIDKNRTCNLLFIACFWSILFNHICLLL